MKFHQVSHGFQNVSNVGLVLKFSSNSSQIELLVQKLLKFQVSELGLNVWTGERGEKMATPCTISSECGMREKVGHVRYIQCTRTPALTVRPFDSQDSQNIALANTQN